MLEPESPNRRPSLLIVTHDVVDVKVAGLGMRYLEFARALARDLDVTLASPYDSSLIESHFRIARYSEQNPETLQAMVEANDVALISGYMVDKFAFLRTTTTRLIVDLITPFVLENLHYHLHEPIESREIFMRHAVEVTNQLAQVGDFFICGSERQRDFWLGLLAANHRLNPRTARPDSTGYNLIDVVGFGIPDRPPRRWRPVLREAHPRFGLECEIVWWGGGVWDWLDPVTLVRAWPQVIAHRPEARLVFLSTQPNPLVPRSKKAGEIERLAEEMGERERSIFFLEWLSYEDREALLCEADVGVVLHPLHLETHFSVRTRVMDYIWAGLPILTTEGDVMSELVRARNLGRVVPPLDPGAVAAALGELMDRPKSDWAGAFAEVAESVRWTDVVRPIRRYCLEGGQAPDRIRPQPKSSSSALLVLRSLVSQAWRALGVYGPRRALVRAARLLRQQRARR